MRAVTWYWEQQELVELDVISPTENTYYTLFEGYNVVIHNILYMRLDDDADTKSVWGKIAMNDSPNYISGFSGANNTWKKLRIGHANDYWAETTNNFSAGLYTNLPFDYIKVELNHYDAPGANAELYGRFRYSILKEV